MLQITIPPGEFFNNETGEFVQIKGATLQLEHSLISLSKWEAKWNKAYLTKNKKTTEETYDYIRCMTLTKNVDPNVYYGLTSKNVDDIVDYINAPMTATHFRDSKKSNPFGGDVITSELIYYWMVSFNIPFECQKWHINRLITLIRVCMIKNQPAKKMSRSEIMRQNAAINAARRKRLNTKG